MGGTPWWVSPVSVAIGAALGFGIAEYRDWRRRERDREGHLAALAAEIQICGDIASGYLGDKFKAPGYRMPLVAYERSLPALLADGALDFEGTNALIRFYVNARAFNFSLDQVQALLMRKAEDRPPKRVEREVSRAQLKAQKLQKNASKPNHYDNAIAAIWRRLPQGAQQRLTVSEELKEEGDDE